MWTLNKCHAAKWHAAKDHPTTVITIERGVSPSIALARLSMTGSSR